MPRILARPALFVLIAFVALLAPQFAERAHATNPKLTVDSTSDSVATGGTTLGLREAVMLSTGDLVLADLSAAECDNVSFTDFLATCVAGPNGGPGPNSADTIVFDPLIFPADSDQKIKLFTPLQLDTGDDTIDGSGAGVALEGIGPTQDCIVVESDGNTVKGLRIRLCLKGVFVFGGFASSGDSASNNVIGGTTDDERNVFSLNVAAVVLAGNAHNNRVIGNYIGTNIDGTAAIANDIGVAVTNEAHDNVIGGATASERNVISGNTVDGVRVAASNRTVIQGNYIGTNAAGAAAIPNGNGVSIKDDSLGNIVGGDDAGEGNLISGNSIGVELTDGSVGNRIQGNYIGTNFVGTAAIPNTSGVTISEGASGNTIGGESPGERNVISGNDRHGVGFSGLDTTGNSVVGNYIGTSASGEQPLGNSEFGGVEIAEAGGNLIKGNVISANDAVGGAAGGGIAMFNSSGFEIYENLIGVSASGAPLGNARYGIFMRDSSDNVVGNEAGGGNVVAHSTIAGVTVQGSSGEALRNTIRGNSIYSNGGKGIDNALGGNGELPPPVITGFGSVNGTACADCTIDVYSDDEDEGAVYEGATTADGNGDWTLPTNPAGPNVTATATDAAGNTSEFSDEVAAPEPTPTPVGQTPTPPPAESVTWGDNNCKDGVNPVDSLFVLRADAGLPTDTGVCPDMGEVIEVLDASPHIWGDVDCKDGMTPVDSLKILRFDAGLSVSKGDPACPDMGTIVQLDIPISKGGPLGGLIRQRSLGTGFPGPPAQLPSSGGYPAGQDEALPWEVSLLLLPLALGVAGVGASWRRHRRRAPR